MMSCPYATSALSHNSLVDHCRFFAEKEGSQKGKITCGSIQKSFQSLGISALKSRIQSVVLMTLLSQKCGYYLPQSALDPERVAKNAMHSCSTRIYSREEGHEGEFNEEEWERFKGGELEETGALTQEDVRKICQMNATRSKVEQESGCVMGFFDSIFSSGEFGLLFEIGTDTTKDGKPAISMGRWERFYTGGAEVFEEIAKERQGE